MTRWSCHGAACTYALRPTDIVTRKSAFTALLGSPVRSGGPFYLSLKLAPAARPLSCENIRRGFVCQNKTNNAPDRPTRVRGPRCNVIEPLAIEPRVIEPRVIEPRVIEPRDPDQQPRSALGNVHASRPALHLAFCVLIAPSICPQIVPAIRQGPQNIGSFFTVFPRFFAVFGPRAGVFSTRAWAMFLTNNPIENNIGLGYVV